MLNLLPVAQNGAGVIRTFPFLIKLRFYQILSSLCDTNRQNVTFNPADLARLAINRIFMLKQTPE